MQRLLSPEFVALYKDSVAHRKAHGCGGYTFEDGAGLFKWVAQLQPTRVLELGTALGYTASIFACTAPQCRVDTIEADPVHANLAQSNLTKLRLDHRVTIYQGDFKSVLVDLTQKYDLVFFDGFAPSTNLLHVMRLQLTAGGHLICANLGLAAPRDRLKIENALASREYWLPKGSLEKGATLITQKI